jgi:hypothetical protein
VGTQVPPTNVPFSVSFSVGDRRIRIEHNGALSELPSQVSSIISAGFQAQVQIFDGIAHHAHLARRMCRSLLPVADTEASSGLLDSPARADKAAAREIVRGGLSLYDVDGQKPGRAGMYRPIQEHVSVRETIPLTQAP